MKTPFKFLRHLFFNYIFAFFVIFSIYSIPCIFLSVLGVFYLFQSVHWLLFFSSVLGGFLVVLSVILIFRFFRLPHFTTPRQEKLAQKEADDFIKSFNFSALQFNNHKPTLDAIFELNRRIARAFGVHSAHPELDVPVGFFLQSLHSISTDLYEYCSRISKRFRIFNFEPLYFTLAFFMKFIPSSSSKDEPVKLLPNEDEPEKVEPPAPQTESKVQTDSKPSWDILAFFRKLLFKRLFKIIAERSIQLYSGKVLSGHRHFSFRDFSPIRKFFHTRILFLPILCGIFGLVFFVGLSVSGLFYSRDSVCELMQLYRNCKANGLTSFSTLPWDQITFRLFPGVLALTISCLFYFIPFLVRFRFTPFKVQPVPEWPKREVESFRKTKEEFIDQLEVSRLCDFSSFFEVIQELILFTDSCCKKPDSAAYSLTLGEILQAQQALVSRLQSKFDEEFPFINYLTIRDFLIVNRVYNLYLKFFLVFRGLNCCVNPISGSVAEFRIRMNRRLLQSLLQEFLISGNIFLLDLIGFHLVEVYSGYLYFPEKGLPLSFFLAGGTEEQRQSVCTALLSIPDLDLHIQMQSSQGNFNFLSWIPFLNRFNPQASKFEQQIRQSDVVLFLDPKTSDSGKTGEFQVDPSEMPPLTVWVTPATQSPLPCSEDSSQVSWQEDDESVFRKSIQNLLVKNHQRLRSRQTFRFIRDYKKEHGR